MTDTPRLIEFAFPLKQASLDSGSREERPPRPHFDPAHLAGAAATGGRAGRP